MFDISLMSYTDTMKQNRNPFLWLIVFPLLGLGVTYILLRISDLNINRWLFIVVSVLAIAVPVLVLAYGMVRVFRLATLGGIVLASFLSSLVWVILAAIINRIIGDQEMDFSVSESGANLGIYTVITSIILIIGRHIHGRRKPKKG